MGNILRLRALASEHLYLVKGEVDEQHKDQE